LTYCVCFGKVNVYVGELKTGNENIETELARIVFKISKPSAKVAFVNLGNSQVIPLHKTNDERHASYFVNKKMAVRLKKKFLIGGLPGQTAENKACAEGSSTLEKEVDERYSDAGSFSEEENDDDVDDIHSEDESRTTSLFRSDSTSSK